jgi:hypothetical protein
MRYLVLLMISTAFFSCGNDMTEQKRLPANEDVVEAVPAAPAAAALPTANSGVPDNALLKHSLRATTKGSAKDGNLCKALFDDTMPLFPISDNPTGRFFEMNDTGGVYVVIVSAGNTRSTFMLAPHIKDVELLSSVQAPECLSRKDNFFMNENGAGFLYDGNKYVKYHLDLSKTSKGFNGTLTWDPNRELGVRVRYKRRLEQN